MILLDPNVDPADVLRKNRSQEKRYALDHAFSERHSQEDVYQQLRESILDGVLDGRNSTVFAYGPTGKRLFTRSQ